MALTLDGNGTIGGLSAGGLPDASVVQADLATGVAGTGPAFSAYASANQSLSATTWTKIQLNTETFDTNNNFDPTTNYRFTPTVSGYYQINAFVNTSSTSATLIYVSIYKNGAAYKNQAAYAGASGSVGVTDVIYFNGTTDYVEMYSYVSSAATILGNANYTYMSGALVRAA